MFELINGIRSILEASMAVKPGEHVLVISDNESESMWVGQIIMNVANLMGTEAIMTVIKPTEHAAQEPPPSVALAMKSVDVIFRVTDRGNLAHTTARKEAIAAGARFYSVCQIPLDDLKKGVSAVDLRLIKERTEALAQRLAQANVATLTSPLGTNITLSLAGREALALNPLGHVPTFLYYAEAAIAPVEGTAEGTIVADLEVVNWGYLLREPLHYTVKAGKVVDIAGSPQDVDWLHKVAATDENATNIAELGIGTSHIIPLPMQGTRRDAARIGTAHIAIGRNDDIGGKTFSQIHIDSLMSRPTIELDGQCILKDGELMI